ncbi:hypothetical protein AB0D34_00905 [Streptomyces sp. NPDC048420]|uniref:hypothetical protein n=1 Tax=Streptomyces sp. NPDC048420 TaxID=3155755 RepID=UPI003436124B
MARPASVAGVARAATGIRDVSRTRPTNRTVVHDLAPHLLRDLLVAAQEHLEQVGAADDGLQHAQSVDQRQA